MKEKKKEKRKKKNGGCPEWCVCLFRVRVLVPFQNLDDIVVDLDSVGHKVQEPLGVLAGMNSRDGMLVLRKTLPKVLNLLDIVVGRQNVNDSEVVQILALLILLVGRQQPTIVRIEDAVPSV